MAHPIMSESLTLTEIGSLSWVEVTEQATQQDDRHNIQVLMLLAAMEENVNENFDDYNEYQAEFALLNTKLNVLMSLVSDLLLNQQSANMNRVFSLNVDHVAWQGDDLPGQGMTIRLTIFLAQSPRPLLLTGNVIVAEAGEVVMKIQQGSELFFDLLAKLIFRRHRREVANARLEK